MARVLRLPWIIDLISVREPAEIRALADDARLDRRFEARGALLNRVLAGRIREVLSFDGRPFPAVAPRDDAQRQRNQIALQTKLDAPAASMRFDTKTIDSLARTVRGLDNARPLAHAVQQAVGRLFASDYRATEESWSAACFLDNAVRTANPLAPLLWRMSGKLDASRRVLANKVHGDLAGLHATGIAIHNLVRSFERMRVLLGQPDADNRAAADDIVARLIAAPPKIMRQATAGGATVAGQVRPDTLVVFEIGDAHARSQNAELAFMTGTWSQCPAAKWIPALLRAVWERALLLPKPQSDSAPREIRLSWMRAQANRRRSVYRTVLGCDLLLQFVLGAIALLAPAWLTLLFGIPEGAAIGFVRLWGALLLVVTVLYWPGWLEPLHWRWPNAVGLAGRSAMALLYLTLGGSFIWLAVVEGLFVGALAWTYTQLLRADLMTRP